MKNTLKVERAKLSMTQQELADKVGLSHQTINYLKAWRHVPSTVLSMKISKVFGTTVNDIFQLEKEDWIVKVDLLPFFNPYIYLNFILCLQCFYWSAIIHGITLLIIGVVILLDTPLIDRAVRVSEKGLVFALIGLVSFFLSIKFISKSIRRE